VQFIVHGGFFMYLLLLCSVVSVTVMILRGWALRRGKALPARLRERLASLQPGTFAPALAALTQAVRNDPSPLARITQTALNHLDAPRMEAREAVQTRARREVLRMESGLGVLEVIVGIAPLLGLLGAVSGLVTVFGTMGASEIITDPRGIAKGIAEALNTTIAGIAIAIPNLIAWVYFSRKVERLSAEMESLVVGFLNQCYARKGP